MTPWRECGGRQKKRERPLGAAIGLGLAATLGVALLIFVIEMLLPHSTVRTFVDLSLHAPSATLPLGSLYQDLKEGVDTQEALFVTPFSLFCGGLVLGRFAPRYAPLRRVLTAGAGMALGILVVSLAFSWEQAISHTKALAQEGGWVAGLSAPLEYLAASNALGLALDCGLRGSSLAGPASARPEIRARQSSNRKCPVAGMAGRQEINRPQARNSIIPDDQTKKKGQSLAIDFDAPIAQDQSLKQPAQQRRKPDPGHCVRAAHGVADRMQRPPRKPRPQKAQQQDSSDADQRRADPPAVQRQGIVQPALQLLKPVMPLACPPSVHGGVVRPEMVVDA